MEELLLRFVSTEHLRIKDLQLLLHWLCGRLLDGSFLLTAQVVVLDKSPTLDRLGGEIRDVAAEEEQIAGLNLPRESHEHQRVQTEC